MNNNINPLFTGAYGYALPLKNIQGNRIYFPDIPILRDKFITSVQLFLPNVDVSTPDYKSLITKGNKPVSYITLCDLNNKEFISNYLTDNLLIDYKQTPINRKIVLQNSYIYIPDTSELNTDKYLYFIFYYIDGYIKPKIDVPVNLQSVEVLVKNSTSRKYYFPDNRVLVNRLFTNVFAPNYQYDRITTPSGYNSIDTDQVFVTLVYQQDIKINRVPLSAFYQSDKQFKLNMLLNVDFPSSYVEISEEASIEGTEATLLTFQY